MGSITIILTTRLLFDGDKREELKRREFFRWGSMQAAASLRKALHIDEPTYRHIVGSSYADPRAYFLYGVLDEVVKACTASMRWNEFLGNGIEELRADGDRRHNDNTGRVILEAVGDEQKMWARKLTEALVDLICFSRTNEQPYFRIYLATKNLDAFCRLQKDFVEFYACRNANVDCSIKSFADVIKQNCDGQQAADKLWFLATKWKDVINEGRLLQQGQAFKPVKPRFTLALEIASDDERIVLGESYNRFFGEYSRSIHSHIGGLKGSITIQDITGGITTVGMLCFHIINKAYQLSGAVPEAAAKQIVDFWKSGDSIAPKIMAYRQTVMFDDGDLVLVHGTDLAEVREVKSSKYGYKSYVVRYLCNPPLPETPEECIPAMYLKRLIRRREARKFFETELFKTEDGKKHWEHLKGLSDSQLFDALRATFVELAQAGVLGRLLVQQDHKKVRLGRKFQ